MPAIPSGSDFLNIPNILERAGIRAGMVVADLGCGTLGHVVFPAAHRVGPDGMVYAVDVLKSALSGIESRRKLEGVTNVETVWADLEVPGAVHIPPGSLDYVFLVNNMPKDAMLREAAELLKSQGRLLVVDWKPDGAPFGPPEKDRMAPSEVAAAGARFGFASLDAFAAGPYHYGIIFRKR